jgi:glutamate carboxypeptidase
MKVHLRLLAAGFLWATIVAPAAAQLSPAETRIITAIESDRDRTVSMLAAWVNQNSGSHNLPGVEAVGRMVRSELEPLGFEVQWIDMKATGRAGHLVARHGGSGRGKRMLLIGHLDTVFELDSPFQRWVQRGDIGEGPGSGDDKGGIAVIVAALRAMKAASTLEDADIVIILSGDEEDAGEPITVARRDLKEAGRWADVALDFEGLAQKNGQDMGSTARRSADTWTLQVSGKARHSSGVFGKNAGYGAVYELSRILDEFRTKVREEKLTFNVGLVAAGATAAIDATGTKAEATGKTNIVPAIAIARGDLRAIDPAQIERAKAEMFKIVGDPLRGTEAKLTFDPGGYPPMPPTEGNRDILAKLNEANRDMGLAPMGELDPAERGAGDISFVAADVDGLAGMGPDGRKSHSPGETVDIPSIFKQAKRAAILMSRLAAERRP